MGKDEFRKYLEKVGVLELLTKSLVQLYEEPDKPGDAVNYLKNTVGGTPEDKKTIEQLRSENTDLKAKLAELEASQASLESKISALESNTKTDNVVENTPAPEEKVAEEVDTVVAAAPADNSPAEQQSDPDPIPAAADPPSDQVPELMDTDGSAPAENAPA